MYSEFKGELILIENELKKVCQTKDADSYDHLKLVRNLSGKEKEMIVFLLKRRMRLLDDLVMCTTSEITQFKKVNDRLFTLTNKMYEKTCDVYKKLFHTGYAPDFDDDIMIEGKLCYSADMYEDSGSVLKMDEDKDYDSDFPWMMSLIDSLKEDNMFDIRISYNPKHSPSMTPGELGLANEFDDKLSWDHKGIFKDICVCHAIYKIREQNPFSYLDIMRMNDFWCEVRVTHQHITDLKGKRYSSIKAK